MQATDEVALSTGTHRSARSWLLDVGLAVLVIIPGVVNAVQDPHWTVLTIALLAVSAIVLLWRKQAPFIVLSVVSVLAAVADSRSFTLALCLALFTLAVHRTAGRAALGYAIAVLMPLAGTTIKIALGVGVNAADGITPAVGVGTSIVDPYLVIAVAAGLVLQSTRQRRRAQEDLLEQRIESAKALERARITAEMHDIVGHALTVMVSLANGARAGWEVEPERSRQALAHLTEVGRTALEDMQRVLRVLRDSDQQLDEALHSSGYDLPDIETMIEVFHTAGMPIELTRTGDPIPESAMLHAAIHRIIQECLTNVLRYAPDATRVQVGIDCAHGLITIDVVDDGRTGSTHSLGAARGSLAWQSGPHPSGAPARTGRFRRAAGPSARPSERRS